MPSEFKICLDCSQEFEITEGEQSFFASKTDDKGNPFSTPKRCKPCRQKKKARFNRGQGGRFGKENRQQDSNEFGL